MIGYYVHHQGRGHLHRAVAVARELGVPVTGLSSLPRPDDWAGDWVRLAPDDLSSTPYDVDASGALHWVPRGDPGLRPRTAAVSAWIEAARPRLMVVDVSVEIALLTRLHGVPVISVVLPGDRGDAAHRLGFSVSSALVALWPDGAGEMVRGLAPADRARLECVGALSRFPVQEPSARRPGPPRVVALLGEGGGQPGPESWTQARLQSPEWDWSVLGRGAGTWTDRPFDAICEADVVITHAGQNAVAEVAAARRPAVVIAAERPHGEQAATALALADARWPVLVEPSFPTSGWSERLAAVAAYDADTWVGWTDGGAAARFGDVVRRELERDTR